MSLWPKPPIKPIPEHPRFLLTKNHIEHLRENMKSPELRPVYELLSSYAQETLNTNLEYSEKGNYSPELELKIEARAFMFVLGNEDGEYARETIRYAREYLSTVVFPMHVGDITRQIGYAMVMGAMVYDWCYDYLTDDDKVWFVALFKKFADMKEIGYPPTALSPIASHSGEFEIMRDLIGAGIAVYDEDTEMYDLAAGRFFAEYVGYRKYFNQSGNHPQGSSYGSFRYECELWAAIIFDRMGYSDILGDMSEVAYKWFYERLPFGLWFKDGDDAVYSQQKYFLYTTHDQRQSLMSSNFFKNPYLRRHYLKALSLQNYQIEHMWLLLFAEPDAGFKEPNDLPLARKTTFPLTSLVARTSWQTGLDAPTAMAHMKIQEIFTACHMHLDCGAFQLYYKGNLAVSSGIYQGQHGGSGCSHYANYYTRTIAHNCVTVTDPSEKNIYTFDGVDYSHDGGQIRKLDGAFAMPYDEIEQNIRATEQGIYIGPNETTPKFSYIKGDLAAGYGDKVKEYHRSMVFMDLFDDEYPAAFVVFDKVKSADKTFKKRWNLHSIEDPEINGNVTTIKRTEKGFNGKLVNVALLPENAEIVKVGGEGNEYSVEGVNYPNADLGGMDTEGAKWRIEISPAKEAESDTFLNAMYMTDADNDSKQLPMEMIKMEKMTGVSVRDRIVMFSDDAGRIDEKISINIPDNGFKKVSVMLADIKSGVWRVGDTYIEVKENEGVLYFEAEPGLYEIVPSPGEKAQEIKYPKAEKAPLGDFLVFQSGLFLNQPKPTKEIEGVPYVPISFVKGCGAELTYKDECVVIKTEGGEAVVSDGYCSIDNNCVQLENMPRLIDDCLYICLEGFSKLLGIRTKYDSYGKILKISITDRQLNETLKNEIVYEPVKVTASGHDGHLPENAASCDMSTRWSLESDNCWLLYDLGDEKEIGKIMLATYNGQMRSLRFAVEVSSDGETFRSVYRGSASGTTDNVEIYEFDSVKARYLRLCCYGNEMNMWNSVTLLLAAK